MKTTLTTKAHLRGLRVSPRKVRLLIGLIRGLSAKEARLQLQFSSKEAARPVMKLLDSAIANARHNHAMDEKTLVVREAIVDGGSILYRWSPRAFGRATPIRKRTSHVTITLEGEVDTTKSKVSDARVDAQTDTTASVGPSKKAV